MDDLISRAGAIARIDKCVTLSGIGCEPVMAIRDIKALISVLPTIDAIPVEWLAQKARIEDGWGNIPFAEHIKLLIWEWHQQEDEEQEAR